jgi:proteasome lid subunit RPN8/RPN11
MLRITRRQFDDIIAQARKSSPHECCGLIGGSSDGRAQTIYPAKNVAADPLVSYEAAAEDLFAAQRAMRERGEQLLAIYHSHPRATSPEPSPTDVRLAYYPSAVYLIVGLGNDESCLRAFRIDERSGQWQMIDYEIIEGTGTETQSLSGT